MLAIISGMQWLCNLLNPPPPLFTHLPLHRTFPKFFTPADEGQAESKAMGANRGSMGTMLIIRTAEYNDSSDSTGGLTKRE